MELLLWIVDCVVCWRLECRVMSLTLMILHHRALIVCCLLSQSYQEVFRLDRNSRVSDT
jgi:hypothetical protein